MLYIFNFKKLNTDLTFELKINEFLEDPRKEMYWNEVSYFQQLQGIV